MPKITSFVGSTERINSIADAFFYSSEHSTEFMLHLSNQMVEGNLSSAVFCSQAVLNVSKICNDCKFWLWKRGIGLIPDKTRLKTAVHDYGRFPYQVNAVQVICDRLIQAQIFILARLILDFFLSAVTTRSKTKED